MLGMISSASPLMFWSQAEVLPAGVRKHVNVRSHRCPAACHRVEDQCGRSIDERPRLPLGSLSYPPTFISSLSDSARYWHAVGEQLDQRHRR